VNNDWHFPGRQFQQEEQEISRRQEQVGQAEVDRHAQQQAAQDRQPQATARRCREQARGQIAGGRAATMVGAIE
jgi:regulator of protease activity HflC (stomatin/prohibitin superfamily)